MSRGLITLTVLLAAVASACMTDSPTTAAPTATASTSAPPTATATLPEATTIAPTTSTTIPSTTTTTTTTSVAVTTPPCRPNPFTPEFTEELASRYRGIRITAHVHDTRTGCGYSLNDDLRMPTASVFKVMVMAGTLLEAQEEARQLTQRELDLLRPMITESANEPVRALWRSFGSAPWFQDIADAYALDETTIDADRGGRWGLTRTSALDQVGLIRQVLLGEWGPLEPGYRAAARNLMTAVVEDQTWGVTAGVPEDWVVAQKNGFAGVTANSVGWADEPGDSDGYVIAIFTTGWPSWQRGIPAIEAISEQVAAVMTTQAPSG